MGESDDARPSLRQGGQGHWGDRGVLHGAQALFRPAGDRLCAPGPRAGIGADRATAKIRPNRDDVNVNTQRLYDNLAVALPNVIAVNLGDGRGSGDGIFSGQERASGRAGAAQGGRPREPVLAPVENVYADLMGRRPELLDEKLKLHERIIDEFNLAALEKLSPEELARQVRAYVGNYARSESLSLNQKELDQFANEILDEMTGFGPIEPLLKDPTVTDILINTHKRCYIERFGQLEETKVHFKDEAHLLRIVNQIVSAVGRRVDESSPMVDARLPDGSRVNVAVGRSRSTDPWSRSAKFAERVFNHGAARRGRRAASGDGRCAGGRRPGQSLGDHHRRNRQRQDDAAERLVATTFPIASGSSPSRTRRNCNCSSRMSAGWRPARPISRAKAKFGNAISFATRCACVPTASSSASAAAKRRSTCCRR